MPTLVLLNGPPASGKSTIASRLVADRPLALNLDIDVIRGLLGAWLEHPGEAGRSARALAISMARTHLSAGHDVVLPQFLGRSEFIEQLEALASDVGARFVEIALVVDRDVAVGAFEERRAAPENQSHLDAAALVEQSDSLDPIGEMYDRFTELLDLRPAARRISVVRGNVDHTFQQVVRALDV